MEILFEVGHHVKGAPDVGRREGLAGVIIGPLEMREGLSRGTTVTKPCYQVRWADGDETLATPAALEPAPPRKRGDLDTVVSWASFDPAVVHAIKNSNPDY